MDIYFLILIGKCTGAIVALIFLAYVVVWLSGMNNLQIIMSTILGVAIAFLLKLKERDAREK